MEQALRTAEQINQEYTSLCTLIGDKISRMEGLAREVQIHKERVIAVNDEMLRLNAALLLQAQADAEAAAKKTVGIINKARKEKKNGKK